MSFTSEFKSIQLENNFELLTDGFCFYFYWSEYLFPKREGRLPWCVITVYPGAITDFASVPRPLSKWFPRKGRHVAHAAVVHDLLYQFNLFSRKVCDNIFLYGLRVLNMSRPKRYLMYKGVRLFGWRPYCRYKHKLAENCAPLEYYSVLDQPVEISWFPTMFRALEFVSYQENKVLPRANKALLRELNWGK